MICPLNSNECVQQGCPLYKTHFNEECSLYALKKLPSIAKEQEALNDTLHLLSRKVDDLTEAISMLATKLGSK